MTDKEVKELMDKTGMDEEYVRSMLAFKERYEEQLSEVAPMAKTLGMTPEQYISEMDEQRVDLNFLAHKGFDVKTVKGLMEAKAWLETAGPDDPMYGEPTGDEFDIAVGSMRRGMLLKTVEAALKKC
jgi:hypothetical protein